MDARISDFFFTEFGVAGLIVIAIVLVIFKLSADFAKLRTDLQQQATRDLLNKRIAAYDELWSKMRGLALYDKEPLSAGRIDELSRTLSDWYFSANGGLFLTVRTREFYFSLQDVLRVAARLPDWQCATRPDRTKDTFRDFVAKLLGEQKVRNFRLADLDRPESLHPRGWRDLCGIIGSRLQSLALSNEPSFGDLVFTVLQQVSSVLRSNLADGLHSRLETHVPKP